VKNFKVPQIRGKALVHGHCHHKSLLHFDKEVTLLKQTGLDCDVPPSGCWGMAGSFGYETEHYDVGLACGERVLLPAVRKAPNDRLIVTDGFSCREMIFQETDRRPLHFAQVLQLGLRPARSNSEWQYNVRSAALEPKTDAIPAGLLIGGALLAGAAVWWSTRGERV